MCGASCMQGPHQDAQKSSTTSLPLSVSGLAVLPSDVLNWYFTGSPTLKALTLAATNASTHAKHISCRSVISHLERKKSNEKQSFTLSRVCGSGNDFIGRQVIPEAGGTWRR